MTGSADVGACSEGVAFSADGTYVYAGNFAANSITALRVALDGTLPDTRRDVPLPGSPASLRVGSQ